MAPQNWHLSCKKKIKSRAFSGVLESINKASTASRKQKNLYSKCSIEFIWKLFFVINNFYNHHFKENLGISYSTITMANPSQENIYYCRNNHYIPREKQNDDHLMVPSCMMRLPPIMPEKYPRVNESLHSYINPLIY